MRRAFRVLGWGAALLVALLLLAFVALLAEEGPHCSDPGDRGPPRRPVRPIPAGGALALGLGGNKSCAVMKDGTVLCWGNDERDPQSTIPTLFTKALNEERYHGPGYGCALAKRRVTCWDGGRDMPGAAGQDLVELWVGERSGCAKHADGGVDCWGQGEPWAAKDQLLEPTRYVGLQHLDDMIIGRSDVWLRRGETLARLSGADLDELKESTGETRFFSSNVLKCGSDVTCARAKQGHVMCWSKAAHSLTMPNPFGSSGKLKVADGKLCNEAPPSAPTCASCDQLVQVQQSPRETSYPAKCSIEPVGTVFCDTFSVLEGNGLVVRAAPSRRLSGVIGAQRVLEDGGQICVRTEAGWTCWPLAMEGAGTQQFEDWWRIPSAPSPIAEGAGAKSVAVNRFAMCFTDAASTARCYARTPAGSLQSPPAVTFSAVRRIAVGSSHACALGTDGSLRCWGANESGQVVGKEVVGEVSPPQEILNGVTDVAVGLRHTCAALIDHRVLCFGDNPLGSASDSGLVEVSGITSSVKQLAASFRDTCALTEAGSVFCWGAAIGPDSAQPPYQVTGLHGAVLQLAAGGDRVCALVADQGVSCWRGYQAPPIAVPNTAGSVELAVGDAHGCVRRPDGAVRCWGSNELGQAGALVRTTRSEITPPKSCPQVTYEVQNQVEAAEDVSW